MIARMEQKMVVYLSHRPKLYALVVGMGMILFWRGVWHSVDQVHELFSLGLIATSIDLVTSPWWDGPLSLVVGIVILYFTGALTSSFIGNELILSGLRGEKRLTEKAEGELQNEIRAISDIQEALKNMESQMVQLEKRVRTHHGA